MFFHGRFAIQYKVTHTNEEVHVSDNARNPSLTYAPVGQWDADENGQERRGKSGLIG